MQDPSFKVKKEAETKKSRRDDARRHEEIENDEIRKDKEMKPE